MKEEVQNALDAFHDIDFLNIKYVMERGWPTFRNITKAILYKRTQNRIGIYVDSILDVGRENSLCIYSKVKSGYEIEESLDFNGFEECIEIEEFLANSFPAKILINRDAKSAIVILDILYNRTLELITVAIPKLLPWIFEQNPLTEKELEFLTEIAEDNLQEETVLALYDKAYISKICRETVLRKLIEGTVNAKIKSVMERIQRNKNGIREREEDLAIHYQKLREDISKLSFLESTSKFDQEQFDTLNSFFENNKSVVDVSSFDQGISVVLQGYLSIFDEDAYETLSNNANSWYWRYSCNKEKTKTLLDAIFGENKQFKIRVANQYNLDVGFCQVHGTSVTKNMIENVWENPHISHFGCMGNYRPVVIEQLSSGDYIGAISTCIASLSCINVTESATFGYLIKMLDLDVRCLEDKDGTVYTPNEAYYMLLREREEENAEN